MVHGPYIVAAMRASPVAGELLIERAHHGAKKRTRGVRHILRLWNKTNATEVQEGPQGVEDRGGAALREHSSELGTLRLKLRSQRCELVIITKAPLATAR